MLPEIHDTNVNARAIVKADAIKLVSLFRSHLDAGFIMTIIPHLVRHLSSESCVVQTYAAMCIERFLTVKDRSLDSSGASVPRARVTKEHLLPVLNDLFAGLFRALDSSDMGDSDYVMKCIMRVLLLLGGFKTRFKWN